MNKYGGWKIATIRGVDIKIHFTLFFLLFYITLVASAQFPIVIERSGIDASKLSGSSGIWSLVFAVSLFLSILLHEFGHVIMAQSLGVKVRSITLMMLGGVSEMEQIPDVRYGEFKIAFVGPLVSFFIAGVLLLLAKVTNSTDIDFYSYWLSRVNLVLGIFNLLPAIPLDGGRAFRSILAAHQSSTKATINAVRVSKVIAICVGFIGFFGFNLLLILIALFVYSAASSELLMSTRKNLLQGLTVAEITRWVGYLSEDQTLAYAANEMLQNRCRALPVMTHSGDLALITIDRLKSLPRSLWYSEHISTFMEKPSRTVQSHEQLDTVLSDLMVYGALPVIGDGSKTGVLQYQDINDFLEFKSVDYEPSDQKRAA